MKNIKLSLVFFSIATLCAALARASETNFEFYNKDQANGRVKITLKVGNRDIVTDKIVDPDEIYQATIDLQEPVTLTVFTVNQKYRTFKINAAGKTKLFSWNTAKEPKPLYPQTGPIGGLMGRYNPFGKGKTESGVSLSNNISERNIVEEK